MQKIKLLYDIEQLLVSKGKETGICRVSIEILKRISKRDDYEVYPIVTVKKGFVPEEYLKSKGLGYLIPNLVKLLYLRKTAETYSISKRIRSFSLCLKYQKKYLKELNKYDEYISIFSPISPIVYKSKLKTHIIVHDLIPFIMPESCCQPSFVKKFQSWIKYLRADEVICVSESTKKDFLKYRPDYKNKMVKVSYLAADEKFKPTKDSSIYEKYHIPTQKYFLTVSDFNPRKNLIHLLDAFVAFLEDTKAQDITLVLVGPKSDGYKFIDEYIKNIKNYKDKIIFTDFVKDEDMPAIYTMARAFVFPSLYEGFGLPLLEAMQCGTPVISCNNSSLTEVCGNAALYISGKDIKETKNVLQKINKNDKLRQKLSRDSLEKSKKFSWDSFLLNFN